MLMPNGRIMVNCGAATNITSRPEFAAFGPWELNETIKALCTAFPGQVCHYNYINVHKSLINLNT